MLYFLNFDLILDKAFISDAFNNMSFNTDVAPWCYKWMATPAPSQLHGRDRGVLFLRQGLREPPWTSDEWQVLYYF